MILITVAMLFTKYYNVYNKNKNELIREESSAEHLKELNDSFENFIDSEDVALEYGMMLLKKAYPNHFKYKFNKNMESGVWEMTTGELKGVWKVYVSGPRKKWRLFEGYTYIDGGTLDVYFRKNGEVVRFDIGM